MQLVAHLSRLPLDTLNDGADGALSDFDTLDDSLVVDRGRDQVSPVGLRAAVIYTVEKDNWSDSGGI